MAQAPLVMAPQHPPVIRVSGFCKRYRNRAAVQGVALTVTTQGNSTAS
jgi:hypothetical protein